MASTRGPWRPLRRADPAATIGPAAHESERAIQRRRNHQKEMILGGMGISVPLLLIAAVFTGLPGVIAVCVALIALGVVVMRDDA